MNNIQVDLRHMGSFVWAQNRFHFNCSKRWSGEFKCANHIDNKSLFGVVWITHIFWSFSIHICESCFWWRRLTELCFPWCSCEIAKIKVFWSHRSESEQIASNRFSYFLYFFLFPRGLKHHRMNIHTNFRCFIILFMKNWISFMSMWFLLHF